MCAYPSLKKGDVQWVKQGTKLSDSVEETDRSAPPRLEPIVPY
jgi:hypothetical protein